MMWKWNLVIGVLIGLGSVCCRVTVRPQNTVTVRGKRTFLECRTANGSLVREWSYIRPSSNSSKSKTIFNNWNSQLQVIIPRFDVDFNDYGSGTLYTNETQYDDGGTYICTTDVDDEMTRFRAELIVLDSKPVCSVREYAAGSIKTECSVGFSGNWAPKMEWRHHNNRREAHEDGTLFPQGVDYYNNNRTHVTSKLNAVIINSGKDSFSVSCKTFFDARDQYPSGAATNVPDFVHVWTYPVFGSTDSVLDADAALTTAGFVAAGKTLSDQSTDATRSPVSGDMESSSYNPLPAGGGDGKIEFWHWILILIGVVVFAILLISVLSGAIVCIIRKKKTKDQFRTKGGVIYRKNSTRANDPNIYDSILLYDENGYRIPLQDPIDGDSRIESLCRGTLDPYYVTTLTKQSTFREAEKTGKSLQMNEAKAASTEYEKMSKLPNDKVDYTKVSKQQDLDSSKSSEANCAETETDKAYYLQVICDSDDKQGAEMQSSSSQPSPISPSAAYASLIR